MPVAPHSWLAPLCSKAQVQPYTDFGEDQLQKYQDLQGLQGRADFDKQYFDSQQYKDLAGSARGNIEAGAEATHMLGNQATANAIARISPQLESQAYHDQLQSYGQGMQLSLIHISEPTRPY